MTTSRPSEKPQFDVFLCHNTEDKPVIWEVYDRLEADGLKPWIDVEHLQPGRVWLEVLGEQVDEIRSVAVCVGESGIGPWQKQEIAAFLAAFIQRGVPVIPVLLLSAPERPQLPVFLQNFTWVDFRRQRPDPMDSLIWGVTGTKPARLSRDPSGYSLSLPFVRPRTDPAPPLRAPSAIQDDLSSERGINYSQLRDLLDAQQWKAADLETYRVMLQAVGGQAGEYFPIATLQNFPLADLQTIDRLWRTRSNDKFGFRMQTQIYRVCGAALNGRYPGNRTWQIFGDRVGWRENGIWIAHSDFNPSLDSPKGCLPKNFGCGGAWGTKMEPVFGFGALFTRMDQISGN